MHRQLSQIGRSSLSFELRLSFEQAAAYRKANGQYVRKNPKSSNMSTGQQKSPHFQRGLSGSCKNNKCIKNQDFLYLLGHSFWTLGDHGRRSSRKRRSLSSMCCGISVSSRLKYSKVFIMFAFAPLEDSIEGFAANSKRPDRLFGIVVIHWYMTIR